MKEENLGIDMKIAAAHFYLVGNEQLKNYEDSLESLKCKECTVLSKEGLIMEEMAEFISSKINRQQLLQYSSVYFICFLGICDVATVSTIPTSLRSTYFYLINYYLQNINNWSYKCSSNLHKIQKETKFSMFGKYIIRQSVLLLQQFAYY